MEDTDAADDDLYVAAFSAEGVDWTKVGRSKDVLGRIRVLQHGLPFPVRLVRVFRGCGSREPHVLERISSTAPRRGREWFRLDSAAACVLVEKVLASPLPTIAAADDSTGMRLKTSYYPRTQLSRLKTLAKRLGLPESVILREALERFLVSAEAEP